MIELEDGNGRPEAETYLSVEEADAYHAKFGNARWSDLSEEEKEIALRKATRNIDLLYVFKGAAINKEQALSLPTNEVGIGRVIKEATAEMALVSLDVDVTGPLSNGNVQSEEVKLGELATKTSYFSPSGSVETNSLRKVDLILQSILGDNTDSDLFVSVIRG